LQGFKQVGLPSPSRPYNKEAFALVLKRLNILSYYYIRIILVLLSEFAITFISLKTIIKFNYLS
jgi:hypothetical protein